MVKARAELEDILSKKDVSVPLLSVVLDTAVEYLASAMIATQPGAVNPTSNFSTEDFSRSDGGNEAQVDFYYTKAINLIGNYITITDTTTPIPQSMIIGEDGVRIGEYEELD